MYLPIARFQKSVIFCLQIDSSESNKNIVKIANTQTIRVFTQRHEKRGGGLSYFPFFQPFDTCEKNEENNIIVSNISFKTLQQIFRSATYINAQMLQQLLYLYVRSFFSQKSKIKESTRLLLKRGNKFSISLQRLKFMTNQKVNSSSFIFFNEFSDDCKDFYSNLCFIQFMVVKNKYIN